MRKLISVISAIVGCTTLLLAGCTPNNASEPPKPDVSGLTFSTSDISSTTDIAKQKTSFGVKNVTSKSFVILDGGSSSCPNVVQEIILDDENKNLIIKYEILSSGTVCTADFVFRATQVNLDNKIDNLASYKFSLITQSGDTETLPVV